MYSDLAVVTTVTISLYTDLRYRKIYNSLLFPSLLLAFAFNIFTGGLGGLVFTLKGVTLGLLLLLIPFILGGMGAGDVKLLAVIGAWQGSEFVLFCFLCTALIGGIIAAIHLIKSGRFIRSLKFMLLTLTPGTPKVNAFGTLANAKAGEAFPYGVAIAAGTLATYILR